MALNAMLFSARLTACKADNDIASFAGNWKGICQVGNPFVILTLKVSGNGFTMSLDDPKTAKLRFLGTPVEDYPWQLTKIAYKTIPGN